MKLPELKRFKWNYLLIAFFIPVVIFLALMILGGITPFGSSRSMLYSDMYHQYYPFFVEFRRALRSGSSLLYNWNIGMGLDYLGLVSYYLASPLNLISVILPESWLLGYFSLLAPIKLGFASLFFAIFLKKVFHINDLSISLFGAFYGLCAWALGYHWNVMWLDTFAVLPLVVLGTVSLLKERKFALYTVMLAFSIFSNYYIGFFVCIFVLLICICYEICRFQSFKKLFADFGLMVLFSALAIGITAILQLPALAALQTTQSSVNEFPTEFSLNIVTRNDWLGLLEAMRQVAGNMGGGLEPTFKEGLPNLYCGVGSIVLGFLYLTSPSVKCRDKLCAVGLLILFMVSFVIRQLDYVWHGFHFPNMIPYRFSFLFSFVLLYMAYKAYTLRHEFKLWQIITAIILALGVFACGFEFSLSEADASQLTYLGIWACDISVEPVYVAYNLIFLILYSAILIYPASMRRLPENPSPIRLKFYHSLQRQKRRIATYSLAGILAAELVLNVVNFGLTFAYTGITNYPKGTSDMRSTVAYMHEAESGTLFYRAETTHSQTLNDGALNGYAGISSFTSSANVRVTRYMKALGYGAKDTYNRYCYEEASPVSNLFLGIKYMIDRDGIPRENAYFDTVYTSGKVTLLENNAYLPLGFLTDVQLTNVDFDSKENIFQFQNKLITASTGINEDVWTRLTKDCYEVTSDTVEVSMKGGSGYVSYNASAAGTVTYKLTANTPGFLCLHFNLPKRNSYTVKLNGEKLYSEDYSLPQCIAVSDVEPGDEVLIELKCKAGENSSMTVTAAILNEEVFRQAYDVLSASTLELQSFTATQVEGVIECNRDGLLYTSIPQNGNWTATVDGKQANIVLVGDTMIAVPLTEGVHSVVFTYHNEAFSLGWKVTLFCALVFMILLVIRYKPKHHKGKFEK